VLLYVVLLYSPQLAALRERERERWLTLLVHTTHSVVGVDRVVSIHGCGEYCAALTAEGALWVLGGRFVRTRVRSDAPFRCVAESSSSFFV
jgi:hypothetical protein